MLESIKVDLDALRALANSLASIRQSMENVVDSLPAIKNMSSEAWPGDRFVADIFEENCQTLQRRCTELKQSIDTRSKSLSQAEAQYRKANAAATATALRLSGDNVFS